jgi:hypothetical protein
MGMFKRIASFIYPPIGLIGVKQHLVGAPEDFRDKVDESIDSNQYSKEHKKEVFEWAKFIYESEIDRKEVLEGKAQSYIVGLSIATGIFAAIPFFFSDRWSLPDSIASLVATMFTLSIFYIVSAGYYALKTRQGGSFYLPSSDMFAEQIREHTLDHEKNSSLLMFISKNNESILTEKSNYLYVAEMSFVRAILIVAASVTIAVGSKLYFSESVNNNKSMIQQNDITQMKKDLEVHRSEVDRLRLELSQVRDSEGLTKKELVRLQADLDSRNDDSEQSSCASNEKVITIHCTRTHEAGVPFRYAPMPPASWAGECCVRAKND